jgi:hypothetical protein
VIQSITLLIDINAVTKAISNVLAGLSERVEVLEKKHRAFGLQETATNGHPAELALLSYERVPG